MTEKTEEEKIPFYFIWNCVSKRGNLGTIMRSCAAFNCKKILVAGQKKHVKTLETKEPKRLPKWRSFLIEAYKGVHNEEQDQNCGCRDYGVGKRRADTSVRLTDCIFVG